MRYGEWLESWLELYVKASTKEQTYRKYRRQAEKYLLPELGGLEVGELTAMKLQRFSLSLSERGLSPSSVGFLVTILKSSLKKGALLGAIERQYSDAVVRPRPRTGRTDCLSKAEQKRVEEYIRWKQRPALSGILICLYSGLRIGELLALTWADIDFERKTMTITKSCRDSWVENRYVKIIDTPKTPSSERVIPLPRQLVGYLRILKRKTGSSFVVPGKSEYGAEIRSYQRTFSIVLKNLQIRHMGFHALRHTFATRALEVGMDVKTLSEILGHKSPEVTLRRYAHSLPEHKAEMMNRIGRLLG